MTTDAERPALRGLCMTCNHFQSCMHATRSKGPIWFCEEFDDSGPMRTGPVVATAPTSPPNVANVQSIDLPSTRLGLCSNCEEHPTCTFSKPEGGIWHCEEYR